MLSNFASARPGLPAMSATSTAGSTAPPQPPIPEALLTLAPLQLPNHRHSRYGGDELCLSLADLAEADQRLLRHLYAVLSELLYSIAGGQDGVPHKWRQVEAWVQRHGLDTLIDQTRELGVASHQQSAGELLAKTVHDLRGGALSTLLGRLQLLDQLPHDDAQLNRLFVLSRDHLKIMRNAITDLDAERREADRKPKAHAMQLMLDKWQNAVVGPKRQEPRVEMHIDCRYEGALTECCLESAAIDRIFYNLTNNAARHAANGRLDMVIFPVPDAAGGTLRFVLSNEVSDKDAASLRLLTGSGGPPTPKPDPGQGAALVPLFTPRVSSTGSGLGLTVVADFVAKAFGLPDRRAALQGRYVGATLDGRTFRAWFHWLAANDDLPPKLDDFHQPEQSLSEP